MSDNNFSRIIILNLITAMIISLVACYFLKTVHLEEVMHIANIFGLYFLTVFGIDILIESGNVKNNYQRFLLVIGIIIVFDILFLVIVQLFFGNVFTISDYLTVIFDGLRFDMTLNTYVYLAIFGIIMLIFNFLLYLKDRNIHNGE